MKRHLERLGLRVSEETPKTAKELTEIMETISNIHQEMLKDIILQPAAYGCAVGGLSLALDVSIRTAAMVFEEWNRLHPRNKPAGAITVVVINPEESNG